ncbi:MAG: intermembrane transport protein PqiB, partial [Geminicoccaceae bacterium]
MNEITVARRSASDLPEATIKKRRGISIVWLIPLVAAVIGAFLAYRAYTSQGPTITIAIASAEGLEAGKTKIRYLDVEVGTVQSVVIGTDLKHILVTAEMVAGADQYLRQDTTFWIVKPRIGVGGVSGLGTLLSGAYIGLAPGSGESERSFTGLEQPPPISANVPGREFVLTAPTLGSVSPGAPIYYRGLDIGQVLTYQLAENAREIDIKVFVREPFTDLIRSASRFWNASGIDVSTGAAGIDVHVASLQALLVGGIEVDTPLGLEGVEVAEAGMRFPLYANQRALAQAQFTEKIPYLVYFDGSVRGLNPGAPVEFRGIAVGTVTSVQLEFDPATSRIRIPVTIEIEPQRIIPSAKSQAGVVPGKPMAELVARGLRAQLQTGNLLTGELFVDLVLVPDAPKAELVTTGPIPEIPSIPATLD